MIKLGIIGTNWITEQFINACQTANTFELTTVYSRTKDKAMQFGSKYGAKEYFDDLDQFFKEGSFETVYIASPNSMHHSQALQAIQYEKHVIVEKPIASNPSQFGELKQALKAHSNVRLFEAARHVHQENFEVIKNQIKKLELVQGASLTYAKYSSKYDQFLSGSEPNVFSLKFDGGALQDLGIYIVYDAVAWFGVPDKAEYFPIKLSSGVDGRGVALLTYPDFQVELNVGKNINSKMSSEIYGLKDTIQIDNPAELSQVFYIDSEGTEHRIGQKNDSNPMIQESEDFANVINNLQDDSCIKKYENWLKLSEEVNQVLYKLRSSSNIEFDHEI